MDMMYGGVKVPPMDGVSFSYHSNRNITTIEVIITNII